MKASQDERPMPAVDHLCARCSRTIYAPNPFDHFYAERFGVVSPQGVAHIGLDYGETACGIDATGPTWWWRL